ncbi:MAG: PRC-barrel domain-containing protein [Croceibacterium sp.]
MKTFLIASAALAFVAVPAQAQLGGSLGGVLGGSGGGSIGVGSLPTLPSPPEMRDLPVRGAVDGAASGSGSARADRRSGRVDASGSGNASGAGTLNAPLLGGSGAGSASGSGSASAQLIGTDHVGSTARSVRGTAQGAAQGAVGTAGGLAAAGQAAGNSAAGYAGSIAGSAAASGHGAAGGMFSGAAGQLALAGSAAAAGNGMFAVDKGMPVLAPDGEKIGKVRQVLADSRGQVQALLVKVDGEKAVIPAAQFSGSGNAVVSAMGETTIKQIADQQDETGANDL